MKTFLLGLQIGYFALLLPLVFYLVYLSYKTADRGLDALEKGRIVEGLRIFAGAIFLGVGSAFGLPLLGYWLTFEGGIRLLL